ncbi:hypothetical protein [Alkalibacter mobilis]|uniref:hypothetical protein n=1 Tax=Alkalibacter mobilis TaxID=2787712 RepID=UPI00189FF1E4|nr:hypothetical protein [Alkalibacter mobilis]MBF7097557.1 hypothetical protein [Alkalibacter mobilis]
MKRMVVMFIVFGLIIITSISGCTSDEIILLEELHLGESYFDESSIFISGSGIYKIPINCVPGKIRIRVYDESDGINSKNENIVLSIYDENDDLIESTDGSPLSDLSLTTDLQGEGMILCESNKGEISLGIAYASIESKNVMEIGKTVPLLTSTSGTAVYKINLSENQLVKISGKTAFLPEEDCSFSINDGNKLIVADVDIHSTEWNSRYVYMKAGSYDITFENLDKDSICQGSIDFNADYYPVKMGGYSQEEAIKGTEEINLGFIDDKEQWLFYDPQKDLHLTATVCGLDDYYDRETYFNLEVYNSIGELMYSNGRDMSIADFILPGDGNRYYVKLSLQDSVNGVVKVKEAK